MPLALLPLALLGLLGIGPARASSNPRADQHLQRRQYRLAAQLYREALVQAPDDPSLRLGLARAWAGLGWCERAVEPLLALRSSAEWSYAAALDLGSCLADQGRGSEGVEVLEEAVLLSGEGTGTEVRLAWEALAAGDMPLFSAMTAEIEQEDPVGRGALLLRGVRAWVEGDLQAMAWHFEDLRAVQPKAPQADLVEAWAALEQGDPQGAAEVLRGGHRFHRMRLPEVATWLAEANRRAGRPDVAHAILYTQAKERDVPMTRQALRLRLQVDEEGPAAAAAGIEALLAQHPLQREVLATAWYAAQAAGDPDRAQRLAARYAQVVPEGRWPLAVLLPLPPEAPSDDPIDELEQP
ncbi:hypothetical protein L6R53_20745 [Myxococcota bacterium]|nr:hypothetical protein [Myxococcota bacterium]